MINRALINRKPLLVTVIIVSLRPFRSVLEVKLRREMIPIYPKHVNPIEGTRAKSSCPKCDSSADAVPIRYGYFRLDDEQVKKDVEARKYILGGCVVRMEHWYCFKCRKIF